MNSIRGLVLLAAGAALCSQFESNSPETVIRTTARLVQVLVMAEDSKGNPVTDLQKKELQLQDNRKSEAITFFSFEGGNRLSAATSITA